LLLNRIAISTAAVVGLLVAVIAVASVGYLFYSSGGGAGTGSTSLTSTSTSGSTTPAGSLRIVLGLQASKPLVSSNVVANYTLNLTVLAGTGSPLAIIATASGGVTVQASPAQIQAGSESNQVTISFKVPGSVAAGTYQFNITVSSSGQTTTQKFNFEVVKYLVVTVGTSYLPAKMTVSVGSTVYWVRLNGGIDQYDNGDHNVVFNSIGASSPTLAQYQSWSYVFSQAGTFSYYCTFHPAMTGEIIVA
jgi:plastocyanin